MTTKLIRIPSEISTQFLKEYIDDWQNSASEFKALNFFSDHDELMNENRIYEGLITSLPFEIVIRQLGSSGFKIFSADRKSETISIETVDLDHAALTPILNRSGWYIATKDPSSKKVILLEPKYDLELTETTDLIYHAAERNQEKISRIEKIGLIPKSGNKKSVHPERIYFGLSERASTFFGQRVYGPDGYVVFAIKTDKLLPGTRFFKDRNMTNHGIYTLSNIPPEALKII